MPHIIRKGNIYTLSDGTTMTEAERQRYRRANLARRSPAQIARARIAKHPDGKKTCRKCQRPLDFAHFADSPRERDGLNTRCFSCRAVKEDA